MPMVDSKGRSVLPKALRERLELDAGTEGEIRAEDDALSYVWDVITGDIDAVVRPMPRCSVHTPC